MTYSGPLAGHPELWEAVSMVPESRGPEADLQMWLEAEDYLNHLCDNNERSQNDAVVTALTDCYNRCVEERRRAEDLLKLREVWRSRGIGGVEEPPSPFAE